jgi:UDP-glucose 4-epimerase
VLARARERKDVSHRIEAREVAVQPAQLVVRGQPDGDGRRLRGEARLDFRQGNRTQQQTTQVRRWNRGTRRLEHLDLESFALTHRQQVNRVQSLAVRILVSGGAGFIGSHVVDAYIAAGHEVAVLDNFSTGREDNVNQAAAVHRVDLRDQPQVEKAVSTFRPQLVNHHAAQSEVPKSVADPTYDAQVNIIGGLNLLKACVDHNVRKVIFSSTGGALYGEPDVVPAAENHPVRPLSPYGTSKFAFEQYLGTFRRTFGLDYTVLRYANIYGARQDFHAEEGRVIAIFASRMLEGKPLTIDGTGEQSRDMLHVGDVATANLAALEKGSGGTFHVSTGIPVTVNDLYRKLALLTGYRLEPNFGPSRKGDVYRIALDNQLARVELGWEPRVSLEEGLSLTVDYFREQVSRPSA